jgi:hypothetical protein
MELLNLLLFHLKKSLSHGRFITQGYLPSQQQLPAVLLSGLPMAFG